MGTEFSVIEPLPSKPIRVGLTCRLWQRSGRRVILKIAQAVGVMVQLTRRIHGLHREIECQVMGANIDRFIGESARRC